MKTFTPPLISVAYDLDEGLYIIWATSHSTTEPAGHRLLRAEPWPNIKFAHVREDAAEEDAQILREYLDDCANGTLKEKRVKVAPMRTGWWE